MTAKVQSPDFAPFREQVEWELDHLDKADVIVFWFDPAGKAPVTLMELGLHAVEGKAIPIFQDDENAFVKAVREALEMKKRGP